MARISSRSNACMLLVILSYALAQDCDLKMESFEIGNPDPSVDGVVYERGIGKTVGSVTMYVRNAGPNNLPAASSGMNYDVNMYIAALDDNKNMVDPVEMTDFDPRDGFNYRSSALDSRTNTPTAEHFYNTQFYDITYPSDKCRTHSHICVRVERSSLANYTDNNSTNDIDCLKFVRKITVETAGRTNCPSEVAASNLVVIPVYANYSSNSTVDVTFSIDLENKGGTQVPGGESNIDFRVFIADSQSDTDSVLYDLTDSLTLGDLSSGIDEWDKRSYSGNQVSIQIPTENCKEFLYFCVKFEKGDGATYEDADESNNLVCLEFGESGIGPIECLGGEPTDLVTTVTTTPIKEVTTPNMTTEGAPPSDGNSGYVNLHVGAIAGIAIGCAITGAGVVLSFYFLRSYLSSRARVHTSPESGNAESPRIEKKPKKTKPPEEDAVTPSDPNPNGDAKPVAVENPVVDMA